MQSVEPAAVKCRQHWHRSFGTAYLVNSKGRAWYTSDGGFSTSSRLHSFSKTRTPFRVWTYCSCSPTTRSSIHRLDIINIIKEVEKLLKISLHSNDGEILHADNSFIYCKISNYCLRQSMLGLLSSFKLRRETCQLLCVRQQRQKNKNNFFTFSSESLSRFRYSAGGVWFFCP